MKAMIKSKIIFPILSVALAIFAYLVHKKISVFSNVEFFSFVIIAFISYIVTDNIINVFKEIVLKKGIFGMDINKRGTPGGNIKIPESCGVACVVTYMILITCLAPYFRYSNKSELENLLTSATLSASFCCFLGFADDVLDLKWRYKIIIPIIASLPIIVNYPGTTYIKMPKLLRGYLGFSMNIGILYYLYMSMLSIFCMNSINIYAGINGLEVGQSVVIGFGILLMNLIDISSDTAGFKTNSFASLLLIVPFIAVSLALMKWNRYPSKVFIGDTYCYFAGIIFACCGILGHFSKGLLLLFIPQIFNFVVSLPQLFGIKHCPRHRLAKYDKATGLLNTTWPENNNMLNFSLYVIGPTSEQTLANYLIILQLVCCSIGIIVYFNTYDLIF